jgi:beta-glucanase (GH16 family)
MIGRLTVSVSAGDLTEQKVDAIVNSTNLELDFTQGKYYTYTRHILIWCSD